MVCWVVLDVRVNGVQIFDDVGNVDGDVDEVEDEGCFVEEEVGFVGMEEFDEEVDKVNGDYDIEEVVDQRWGLVYEFKVCFELVIVFGGDGVFGLQQRVIVRERGEENIEEEVGSYRQLGLILYCEIRLQSLCKVRRGVFMVNDYKGCKGFGILVVFGFCSFVVIDEVGYFGWQMICGIGSGLRKLEGCG